LINEAPFRILSANSFFAFSKPALPSEKLNYGFQKDKKIKKYYQFRLGGFFLSDKYQNISVTIFSSKKHTAYKIIVQLF
jgi:hypothetical protein